MPSEARRDEAFILKSFNMQEDIYIQSIVIVKILN